MLHRWSVAVFVLVALIAASGCEKKVQRFHVWGKITYQGQPIPAGSITFDPDLQAGADGPQGFAIIKNGEFDTRKDGGIATVGGKYMARVYATDGVAGPEIPNGRPLFPERSIPQDLPKADGELNIDVPRK
ncbi:hypothetical protein [Anatilimnocola floriformis]|uniref:hypothetical protein n=1 Tax=Anatilimnocola floriformis TaxID=2948575 RepID=UPI0020C32C18|nr:hypothetical protein [Anatilimnocola floriformis]